MPIDLSRINPAVFKIPKYLKEPEDLVIWSGAFTEEQLEDIINLGDLAEFSKGSIGNDDNLEVNSEIRDSDISWILPDPSSEWLYEGLKSLISLINHDKYQYDLENLELLQYTKYKIDHHYTWHIDLQKGKGIHRKLSLIVGLTDPDDYEGGDVEFNFDGHPDNIYTVRIKKGDILFFPSYIPHRVTPITSGNRTTLVAWINGPKYK